MVTGRVVDHEDTPFADTRIGTGTAVRLIRRLLRPMETADAWNLQPRETAIKAKGHGPDRISLMHTELPPVGSSSVHRGRSGDVWSIATVDRFPAFR